MTAPSSPVPAVEAADLLACPFCGEQPISALYPENHSYWTIGCSNDACLVSPEITAPGQKAARARWNNRTPTPGRAAEPDAMGEVTILIGKLIGALRSRASSVVEEGRRTAALLSAVRTIVTRAETAEAQLATLRAEVEQLRDALLPFSRIVHTSDESPDKRLRATWAAPQYHEFTTEDIQRAATLLSNPKVDR